MKRRMGIAVGIALAVLLTSAGLFADEMTADAEEDGIRAAINRYLEGTSYNKTDLIASAFYEEAPLFLSHPEREIWAASVTEYTDLFKNREVGKFNGRTGNILAIDRSNDIATAKAEIRFETNDARYIDLFLLKKIQGEWKIISKAATRLE